MDCGCTSTSSRSARRPKRWCASISSSPLFIRLAESMLIFDPIDQTGWAAACAGVAAAIRSRVQVRNGPPEAVSVIESDVLGPPGRRAPDTRALCSRIHRQDPGAETPGVRA